MATTSSLNEYTEHLLEDKVIDFKNPLCHNCNECCTGTAMISEEEYRDLMDYFENDKQGRKLYNIGKNKIKKHLRRGTIYLLCPLSDDNKRCTIYERRPAICRDFHCSVEAQKTFDKKHHEETKFKMIFELFVDMGRRGNSE